MSEQSTPEFSSEIVSITEAAARLNISVRTVQRRLDAGTLATIHDGDTRRVMLPSGTTSGTRHDATAHATDGAPLFDVSRDMTRQSGNVATSESDSVRETHATSGTRHDATAHATNGTSEGDTSRDTRHDSDTAAALLAEKDARITDLRAQVAAQSLQIEAANRQASEATAALREYLKISNRAIMPPANESAHNDPEPAAPAPATANTSEAANVAQRAKAKEARPLWRVILGIR